MRLRRLLTRVAAAMLMLAVPAIARAEVLVVDATGPSAERYPRGMKLADDAQLTLADGDRLTVLDDAGTRVFTGPLRMSLSQQSRFNQNRVRQLAKSMRDTRQARAGAVRGAATGNPSTASSPRRPIRLWFVNADEGGIFCTLKDARPRIFRSRAIETMRLRFDPADGGEVKQLFLPKNAYSAPIPVASASQGGRVSWHMTDEASGKSNMITLITMATPGDGPMAMAEALLDNGCIEQLAYFTERLRLETAPTGPGNI